MNKVNNEPVPIILDTDIGPDCDDAGALAILLTLASQGEANILGVMHCTSSPWGEGCISAINTYYGRPDIPIGTLQEDDFLNEDSYMKYNRFVAEKYPNAFNGEQRAEDATVLYRKLLSEASDGSVVIVAIGPLINFYHLMNSGPDDIAPISGIDLIRNKVKRLVVMGGAYPEGKEWNFEMHPVAAKRVADQWPTPILFCGYEVGVNIQTGSRLFRDTPPDHPVRKAYELYLDGRETRSSWDLITVLIGVRGLSGLWDSEQNGRVEVKEDGATEWRNDPSSDKNHGFVIMKDNKFQVEALLDELMWIQTQA